MSRVARYVKLVAVAGRGRELADVLLSAAESLEEEPACELYLVNSQADAPDTVWVTEVWRSKAELDAVLAQLGGNEEAKAAMGLVAESRVVDLSPWGGKGLA